MTTRWGKMDKLIHFVSLIKIENSNDAIDLALFFYKSYRSIVNYVLKYFTMSR
jgi:hypothetical protein